MRLVIFADGSAAVGAGHVLRCLAIAEAALERGLEVSWVARDLSGFLAARVRSVVDTLVVVDDDNYVREAVSRLAPTVLLIDTYHLSESLRSELVSAAPKIAVLDDTGLHDSNEFALIVNPNCNAVRARYNSESKVVCGTQYAPLRKEFLQMHSPQPAGFPPKRILITMGGGDSLGLSSIAADVAKSVWPAADVDVLVGPVSLTSKASYPENVLLLPPQDHVAELFTTYDLVVSAAGSTVWELSYLGRAVVLAITADNQAGLAETLENSAAALVVNAQHI